MSLNSTQKNGTGLNGPSRQIGSTNRCYLLRTTPTLDGAVAVMLKVDPVPRTRLSRPETRTEPAPTPAPTPAPIAAPSPPPATAPIIAPSTAPMPARAAVLVVWLLSRIAPSLLT